MKRLSVIEENVLGRVRLNRIDTFEELRNEQIVMVQRFGDMGNNPPEMDFPLFFKVNLEDKKLVDINGMYLDIADWMDEFDMYAVVLVEPDVQGEVENEN